jgi:hypothetical protein
MSHGRTYARIISTWNGLTDVVQYKWDQLVNVEMMCSICKGSQYIGDDVKNVADGT